MYSFCTEFRILVSKMFLEFYNFWKLEEMTLTEMICKSNPQTFFYFKWS